MSHLGHLEGVPQPQLGDLRSPWLLTTYKAWDDPPSRVIEIEKNRLVVSTHLKNISQIGSFPQVGMKIKIV